MAEFDPARRSSEAAVSPLRSARDLPHSLEAEQAVIGAILTEDTAFDQVAAVLKPADFYLLAHQHVYGVCEELAREAKTLDPVLVQQRLDAKGLLGAAVPHDLPLSLARAIGTAANVIHYARTVQDLARLRHMMLTAQKLVERGYEAGANVQPFLDAAQQEVFGAAAGTTVDTLKKISEPVLRALENLEAVQKRVQAGLSPITGVPTGIGTLDKNTLGLQPGTLTVLAARPSVGKTAFALNIATHAAVKAGKRVAFFSLEMPSDQLALRMLASEGKLDWRRLSQGQLSTHDWNKLATQADRIGAASIWLDDNFVLTPVELRSKCRKLKRENGGLDLVMIDYLQLMHAPSDRSNQSREQEIATISRSLKSLAKELECPIVALSQLNRGVEKRKGEPPMLSDLRESGAIEQDADIVMFLHRNEEENKDVQQGNSQGDTLNVQLIVAKQRQGPTCTIDLVFFKTTTFFAEMERRPGA
ncbi:replicative DNA helicase [Anaeromyxobacter oryzae]|uniref:Replicative DNA helicase n=1 Tax=Anaeromyxobacter oryzae TaxID=2918170 RepID=A0ABM7WVR5_9BACT|nr:replicative DNA helicase [Anaeromyxobacter oryzae]BDG03602.1 replicative DNA helicase [Anaeromyxobacter oryzae]